MISTGDILVMGRLICMHKRSGTSDMSILVYRGDIAIFVASQLQYRLGAEF